MDMNLMLIIGAAVMAGLTIMLLLLALRIFSGGDTQVSSRLQTYLGDQPNVRLREADFDAAPSQQIAERLNEAITKRGFARDIARKLEQANLPLTVPEWLLLRAAIPLVLSLIALVIWREPLIIPLVAFVGFLAPIFWLNSLRNRRSQLFADQLAETLQMLVGALRGGFSLAQALRMVSKEAQDPTRSELERVVQEVQLGLGLNDALDNLTQRLTSEDLELVVTAIKINGRVGGNLTEILESISTTIRERGKLRREVQVITSMQRMSAYVIGLLPFGLAGIIYAINPEYMGRLFTPGITLCIPAAAFTFAVIGFLVIRKIADIKV